VSRKRKVGILPKNKPAWLLPLEDPFQRMRDRLGSSEDAKNELYALLCDRETRSARSYVNASGEEALDLLDAEFWRNTAHLEVDTDPSDGVDHIAVRYPRYVHLSDGSEEFFVRAADVERWERPYSMTAAPPRPPASQPAPDQQPEDKASPDPLNADRPSAVQSSQDKPKREGPQVRRVRQALQELFPPNGHPPVDLTQKKILKRVNEEFFKPRNWKPAKPDSLARAMGRRA
jgi:hypothetical protein